METETKMKQGNKLICIAHFNLKISLLDQFEHKIPMEHLLSNGFHVNETIDFKLYNFTYTDFSDYLFIIRDNLSYNTF